MWYYSNNGDQQGPIEESSVPQLVSQGVITSATFVWREGMADWLPANQSPFAQLLAQPAVVRAAPTARPPGTAALRQPAPTQARQAAPAQARQVAQVNPYQTPQTDGTQVRIRARPLTWGQIFWSFNGRIPRRQFWAASGIWYGILMLVSALTVFLIITQQKQGQKENPILFIPIILTMIPYIWSNIAIQVKRWHDRGKSGAWVLINLIPSIGGIWALVECGCLRGTEGPNQYGHDPT